MLPLKDDNPTSTFPFVTIVFIGINILVFIYQLSLGLELKRFILQVGLIPYEITHFKDLPPLNNFPLFFNFFTSLFIHGGILHLAGNMLFLWIFGNNIEDSMGHFRFVIFYFLCGIIATLTHIVFNFNSPIPTIGASGAISGVLGAYILLFPKARIHTLFIFFIFIRIIPVPAVFVLGLWIFIQIANGLPTVGMHQISGVAWFAHIGGFGAGLLLVHFFRKKRIRRRIIYNNNSFWN